MVMVPVGDEYGGQLLLVAMQEIEQAARQIPVTATATRAFVDFRIPS